MFPIKTPLLLRYQTFLVVLKRCSLSSIITPPWSEPRIPAYATVQEVREHLLDLQYRSVSFDLHGTLVHPRQGWNLRIWEAFRKVLRKYGCTDISDQLEQLFGESGAADFAAGVAKKYYRRGTPLLDELPVLFQSPKVRWSFTNAYALAELIAGDPGNVGLLKQRVGLEICNMGLEVHEHISRSDPDDWYTTPEQRAVVENALSRGLLVMILSNGSYSSVVECTKRYFPQIPPWQVLTPEVLRDKGKPGPTNAVLLLFSLGCAMVRNAIEGRTAIDGLTRAFPQKSKQRLLEDWKRSRAKVRAWLAEQTLQAPHQAIGLLRQGLTEFCAQMGISGSYADALLVMPQQHLHVGNSDHHDALPLVGLGLPFTYLLYAPKPPGPTEK